MHIAPSIVLILCVTSTGVEAELEAACKVNASQSAELADLKEAAATMTHRHQMLAQELQSSNEQLERAQAQLLQLTTERQQLQEQHDAQVVRGTELELELNSSSSAVAGLQGRAQAQTEAASAAQQELQGNFNRWAADQLICMLGACLAYALLCSACCCSMHLCTCKPALGTPALHAVPDECKEAETCADCCF